MGVTKYVEIVSDGRVLRGLKHLSNEKRDKAFVIIHGYFSSNKIGPHRLYVKIANRLSEKYGDCYRFDLSGMGESDGDISEISFDDHVNDVKEIMKVLKKEQPTNNIVIISHCIGCDIVLKMLLECNDVYREIIFLTPYFTYESSIKKFFTDEQQLRELNDRGYTYRKGLYADRSFFYENSSLWKFVTAINKNTNFFNIIAASKDQFIPNEFNEMVRECKGIKFMYIQDADHNFLTKQKELIDVIENIITDVNFSNTGKLE